MRTRKAIALAAGLTVIALLSACSSSTSSSARSSTFPSTGGSAGAGSSLAALVPAQYRNKGTVVVGTQFGFVPFDYYEADGKTPAGFEVELMKMLGNTLDVNFQMINSSFSSMIPGLLAKRYDVYINLVAETPERLKTVDFVDYARGGTAYLFRKDNSRHIETPQDLCGGTVVVVQGTSGLENLQAASQQCKAAGKPGYTIETQTTDAACVLAVQSKRADAYESGELSLAYVAKQSSGVFATIPTGWGKYTYGMLFRPGESGLEKAVSAALDHAIKSGAYEQLLTKYGLTGDGVETATIRPATG